MNSTTAAQCRASIPTFCHATLRRLGGLFTGPLAGLALCSLATNGYSVPLYYADVFASSASPPASTGSTPQSVSETGAGYGYANASWSASASANPGQVAVSIHGEGHPNPFSNAAATAIARTFAVFSDSGGAPTIPVSFNALFDGFKDWSGAFSSDLYVRMQVHSAVSEGSLRNNYVTQVHATGLFAGHVGQTFDDVVLTTGTVMVPVGVDVALEIRLDTNDILSDGAQSTINGGYTLGLIAGGPVFNLPATATVQIADWGVVNNRAPGGGSSVPDGAVSAWLLGLALAGCACGASRARQSNLA